MIFTSLKLEGAFRIDLEKREDTRGFFARLYCVEEYGRLGLLTRLLQMNTSLNRQAGTVRGLHFQRPPMAEAKVVRCLKGAIFDVIIDLRAGSASYGRWTSLELSAENRTMIYVPEGFAHGFQTLMPETELLYMHSQIYSAAQEGGLNHSDPRLGIDWPLPVVELSPRDGTFPRLEDLEPIAL